MKQSSHGRAQDKYLQGKMPTRAAFLLESQKREVIKVNDEAGAQGRSANAT